MGFNIVYKSSVEKDLKRIPKNEAARILNKIEEILTKDPLRYPQLKGEFKGLRKFRAGNFRVIYTVKNTEIIILRIGDRKEVYR